MFQFDAKNTAIVEFIAKYAQKNAVPVYFVGGMVRDNLMGIDILDIDILIEGSAIDFVQGLNAESSLFEGFNVNIKSIHKDFNTAKTIINGVEIDFASTREEEYPHPGCLPVVKNTGCPIDKDLKRRDFTINAIAARVFIKENKLNYELIDLYNGTDDIKARKLKVLHDKSYIDDPTRILRGLDFNLRLGFEFSKEDKSLIENCLKAPDRVGLSIDRVKLTLKKLFSAVSRAPVAYREILKNRYYKIWQDEPGFKQDWAQRLVRSVEIFNLPSQIIFLSVIFDTEKYHNWPICSDGGNYGIYQFFKDFSDLDLALYYVIFGDKKVIYFYKALKNIKPDITGEDLLKQGYKQGREIGIELQKQLKKKLDIMPKFTDFSF